MIKHNLAHSFMSFNTCYTDTGLWLVFPFGYYWILFLLVGPNEAILCFGCKYAQLPQIGYHGNEVKGVSDDWLEKKSFFLPSLTVTPNDVSLLKGMTLIMCTNDLCVSIGIHFNLHTLS